MPWTMAHPAHKAAKRYCINGSDLYGDLCSCLRLSINSSLMFDSLSKPSGLSSVDFAIKAPILNSSWIAPSPWRIAKEAASFKTFLSIMPLEGFWALWVSVRRTVDVCSILLSSDVVGLSLVVEVAREEKGKVEAKLGAERGRSLSGLTSYTLAGDDAS